MLAMVARQPLSTMLPVSASASSSMSAASPADSAPPVTACTSAMLLDCGKISRARPENTPEKSWRTATSSPLSRSRISVVAPSRVTTSTEGTDSSTCSPTILRRLAAARLTPILTSSVRASRSRSSSRVDCEVTEPADRSHRRRSERKPRMPSSVTGLAMKVALAARARLMISSWTLAVASAIGMVGIARAQLFGQAPGRPGRACCSPGSPRRSRWASNAATASSALPASTRDPFGLQGRRRFCPARSGPACCRRR